MMGKKLEAVLQVWKCEGVTCSPSNPMSRFMKACLKVMALFRRWDTARGGLIALWCGLLVVAGTGVAQPIGPETTGPAQGVLWIHGGGRVNTGEFVALVKKASGKKQPVIRVITTAQGKRRAEGFRKGTPFPMVRNLKRRFDLMHVTELYTLSKQEADRPAFYQQIDNADAVFMTGGNQCYLTDAFLRTESFAALERLLQRGGVVGGASAGAQVQSSFMTRGDYTRRRMLGDKKHQHGFAFVRNAVFDVHVEERGREDHLLQVFRAKPGQLQDPDLNPLDLLGVGIDQGTAIVVTQDRFRVTGKGRVYVFDPRRWDRSDPASWTYQTLASGRSFDMRRRVVIEPEAAEDSESSDAAEISEASGAAR